MSTLTKLEKEYNEQADIARAKENEGTPAGDRAVKRMQAILLEMLIEQNKQNKAVQK